jgi:3-methyladenine DNA glycosylase AlkD
MAAYMKTEMPFYGVKKPQRAEIVRSLRKRYEISDIDTYTRVIEALWVLPHREEKYIAIQLAQSYPQLITLVSMALYERLVREGAWWDLVDDVAIRLVGMVLLNNRDQVQASMDRWIGDRNLWIRRAAIISQIKHREMTDHGRLFSYCQQRSHETEFFIRKGIGWALREYSKTDPDRVSEYLARNSDTLSPLSYREGARRLIQLGYDL